MTLGIVECYLICISIIGFILYGVNTFLYRSSSDKQIDVVITLVSMLGGSLGIVLFILLFDRKSVKDNMMSRVFIICVFIVQIIAYLLFIGRHSAEITLAFWTFFGEHKLIIVYIIVINFVTLIAFGIDKINAIEHRSRIRIITLLCLSLIGGSLGALTGMLVFHHKTNKDYFMVGIPLIIATQAVVTFYLMNAK